MSLLLYGGIAAVFVVGWIIGFISGHSRGKMEAYQEQFEDGESQ